MKEAYIGPAGAALTYLASSWALDWAAFSLLLMLLIETTLLGAFALLRLLGSGGTPLATRLQYAFFFAGGFGLGTMGFALIVAVAYSAPIMPDNQLAPWDEMRGVLLTPIVVVCAGLLFALKSWAFVVTLRAGTLATARAELELRHVLIRQPIMIAGALVAVFLMVEGDAETAGVLLVIAAKFVADVRYAEFAR